MGKKLTFIDVFSGAGGLSEGFIRAGMEPIAHVEVDSSACKTLETRLAYHALVEKRKEKIYYNYLKKKTSRETIIKKSCINPQSVINRGIGGGNNTFIFEQIDQCLNGRQVDILIGGPPCQAYSVVGRSRDRNKMKYDPRNYLYKEYAKFLKRYMPKVFVFENVKGLLTAKEGKYFKNMSAYFRRIGYDVDYRILNSAEFKVVQSRQRVILIGSRKGMEFEYPDFKSNQKQYPTSEVLFDLPNISMGCKEDTAKYSEKNTKYLKETGIRNGVDFVTQHKTRTHNERDLEIYKIAISKFIEERVRLKYEDLPFRLKTHNNQKVFTDRFKVVSPFDPCHTLVAHISKDGHHYIHPDVGQLRSLSIREAARIQSFPDNYYFEGGQGDAFRQIGNAVPPLMSYVIAKKIRQQICRI